MPHLTEPNLLSTDQIEAAELATARYVFHAIREFASTAAEDFAKSPDDQDDIAEDATREALDKFPGVPTRTRLYGRIDFKRAQMLFLPCLGTRQALLVDSKAEKTARNATLQVAQTSLPLLHKRAGKTITANGELQPVMRLRDGLDYLCTTVFVHYYYQESAGQRTLRAITIASLPNGRLASRYVPSADDTLWQAGRNAPTRGEGLRVRLGFDRLHAKCPWRVQRIEFSKPGAPGTGILAEWRE